MSSLNDGNKVIIAISGKQLSGKDTFAGILLEILPGFKRIGLGDAIKIELANIKNITIEELEDNKHLYRPELIELGNKGRQQEDGLYWVNKVLATPGNIIVPDMRVQKEFDAFKSGGGIMVRVESDRASRSCRGTIVREDDPTECALDHITSWDAIIYNNSNLENLKNQASKICNLLPQSLCK